MNKLVLVFGLFALTFFFGIGVTAIQIATDSFFFPFDSGRSFDVDDFFDSNNEEYFYDNFSDYEDAPAFDTTAAAPYESESFVDPAITESGNANYNWTCGDGTMIEGAWTNDGECDCNDCSDEEVFKCSTGQLIPIAYIGDGDCDCADTCEDEGDL